MKPYDPNAKCAKCGCDEVGTLYEPTEDSLHRHCRRCSYEWLEMPIDKDQSIYGKLIKDLELSVRSRNCLRQIGLETVGDLVKLTELELLSWKNFGESSLNEIKSVLKRMGLHLVGQTDQLPELKQ